jgi:hypothetical protein
MIVADTYLISYPAINGLHTPKAWLAYARDPVLVLPPLWRGEFLNAVLLDDLVAGTV